VATVGAAMACGVRPTRRTLGARERLRAHFPGPPRGLTLGRQCAGPGRCGSPRRWAPRRRSARHDSRALGHLLDGQPRGGKLRRAADAPTIVTSTRSTASRGPTPTRSASLQASGSRPSESGSTPPGEGQSDARFLGGKPQPTPASRATRTPAHVRSVRSMPARSA